ncbi:hypothetical protein CSA37_07975 [Candidatus Fermentibacteria bacterium]|nr:MAG: hypothetical protein CSA37_07975 [Candidatus Fermentibacteria bacterium]
MLTGKKTPVAIAGASLLVFFLAVYAPERIGTRVDDAYMYIRYAENFISGHGFAWNISEVPAYSITSPLFLFFITALRSIFHAGAPVLLSITSLSASIVGWK